jgi:hypothetical protein
MKTISLVKKSDGSKVNMPVATWANLPKEKQDLYKVDGIARTGTAAAPEKKNLTPVPAAPATKEKSKTEASGFTEEDVVHATNKGREEAKAELSESIAGEVENAKAEIKTRLAETAKTLGMDEENFREGSVEDAVKYIEDETFNVVADLQKAQADLEKSDSHLLQAKSDLEKSEAEVEKLKKAAEGKKEKGKNDKETGNTNTASQD